MSDELLMKALQQYKQLSQQYEAYCTEEKLDELFLEASQLLEVEPLDNPVVVKPAGKCRPQSEKNVQAVRSHAYRRRRYKTLSPWAQSIWREWATHRLEQLLSIVSPFAKPLSIPGIHFGSATNFITNPELWTL